MLGVKFATAVPADAGKGHGSMPRIPSHTPCVQQHNNKNQMLRQFRFLHRASSGSSKTNDKGKQMEKESQRGRRGEIKRERETQRERERSKQTGG